MVSLFSNTYQWRGAVNMCMIPNRYRNRICTGKTVCYHLYMGILYLDHISTLIPAWINDRMPSKVWDEILNPFPNLNNCTVRWSLGMDRSFQLTHYNGSNYLSMLDLKLYHVSKMVSNDEGKSTQMKQFIHSQCHFVMYFWILQRSHRCCEAITYYNIIVDFLLETLVTAPWRRDV